MKIRHERPMSDMSFQVRAPLGLELPAGDVVTIENWSLSGIAVPNEVGEAPTNGVLSIPFQGVDIRFPVQLEPTDQDQFMKFDGLTGRQRETLAVFYRSILSGKMASTEEVITSLDTPVDLVPMGETEEEETAGRTGKPPRSLRAVASVALYVVLASLAFWTLGGGIYSKLATINISNARIEALLTPHMSLQDAYVEEVQVNLGDRVVPGDVLVRMTNPEDVSALADVRGRIALTEERLASAEARQLALENRIAAVRQEILDRIETATAGSLAVRIAELEAFDGRYASAYRDLFEAHDAASALVTALIDDLSRLRRERGQIKDAADAGNIIATVPGIVTEVAVFERQFVIRSTSAVTIETDTTRVARGWIDPSMAAAVFVGMPVSARVSTSSGPQLLAGRIQDIQAGIDPAFSPSFGMLVTVAFADLDPATSRQTLPHAMPVELRAKRTWAERLMERIGALTQQTQEAS